MTRARALAAGALLAAAPARAQPPARPATDTVRADAPRPRFFLADTAGDLAALADTARRDGREAANRPGTFGHGTLAFFGGVPLGFFGPLVPFAFSDKPAVLLPAAAGAGLIALSATGSAWPPDSLAAQAAARGPAYARAYQQAYADRLGARRRRATLVGGLSGAAVGAGLLIFLVTQLASD